MFSQFELDLVNQELRLMADEAVQASIDLEYEAMIDSWMADLLMIESAEQSYDEDCMYMAEVF